MLSRSTPRFQSFLRNSAHPLVCASANSVRSSFGTRGMARIQRTQKKEGDISSVFASLSGESEVVLPPRFQELKKKLVEQNADTVQASWDRLIVALNNKIEEVKELKEKIIPIVNYDDISSGGFNSNDAEKVKEVGVVVVRNVLPNALELREEVKRYIATNNTKGFPADNPQVFELYWSPSQIKARADPRMMTTQKALQDLWAGEGRTPIVYADRLRMRQPGDTTFALGPHVDGGSLERWEDIAYSNCYTEIFKGNWENYNPFDMTHRSEANMSLYESAGGCSVFRQWQGWLSLSSTGPGEGTLEVNPMLKLATAYWMLRPFFSPPSNSGSLDGWKLDLSNSKFHGAAPGRGQEMNDSLHPHLQLKHSMVNAPRVEPGDYLAWFADTIHAVNERNNGKNDSSVMYIPVVPDKCEINDSYIEQQKESFLSGIPPPDFPGGVADKTGRATLEDIENAGGKEALKAMGF